MQTPFLRIGTRGSKLALIQAHMTRRLLAQAHGVAEGEIAVEIIRTTGDRVQDRPLAEIGGKGLFTKEIEDALLAGSIDLAVHSMKDMPALLPSGLEIAALLEREDPRDAFISPKASGLMALAPGARVGSSSVRRSAQLRRLRRDLDIIAFRGNVDTRLTKLADGVADATFLACAGLNRMGLAHVITEIVAMDVMLPALAQGAIGIECRDDDQRTRDLLVPLHHAPTAVQLDAERAFLAHLDGSCRTPIAGHALLLPDGRVAFRGEALTPDGQHVFTAACEGAAGDAARLGREAAAEVKAAGGSLLTL